MYDVPYWDDSIGIIMEYCDLGNLNQCFKSHTQTLEHIDSKIKLMKKIINGIEFLHNRHIVHRDIKPDNILLKLTPEKRILVKICDC